MAGLTIIVSFLFGCALAALVVSDLRSRRLPNAVTLPLIPAGLAASLLLPERPIVDHLIGTLAGALVLWLVAAAYEQFRRRKGLGMGDVKLFAAAGAWLGWQALPFVLLLATLIVLMGALAAKMMGRKVDGDTLLPLGAGVAPAMLLLWLCEINNFMPLAA